MGSYHCTLSDCGGNLSHDELSSRLHPLSYRAVTMSPSSSKGPSCVFGFVVTTWVVGIRNYDTMVPRYRTNIYRSSKHAEINLQCLKTMVFNQYVLPILTYGSETWPDTFQRTTCSLSKFDTVQRLWTWVYGLQDWNGNGRRSTRHRMLAKGSPPARWSNGVVYVAGNQWMRLPRER